MNNVESGQESGFILPNRDIHRRRRKFARILRQLPQDNQDVISDMTSTLLEPDIYNQFKADPEKIEGFQHDLEGMGLEDGKVKTIFNFFNLPYKKKT